MTALEIQSTFITWCFGAVIMAIGFSACFFGRSKKTTDVNGALTLNELSTNSLLPKMYESLKTDDTTILNGILVDTYTDLNIHINSLNVYAPFDFKKGTVSEFVDKYTIKETDEYRIGDYNRLLKENSWMQHFYDKSLSVIDSSTLIEFYDIIDEFVKTEKGLRDIDVFIHYIDIKKMSVVLYVGILRLLFLHRQQIPSWAVLLEKAKVDLIKRGEDANSILAGLYIDDRKGNK